MLTEFVLISPSQFLNCGSDRASVEPAVRVGSRLVLAGFRCLFSRVVLAFSDRRYGFFKRLATRGGRRPMCGPRPVSFRAADSRWSMETACVQIGAMAAHERRNDHLLRPVQTAWTLMPGSEAPWIPRVYS
jgi:hypothetical protein